MGGVVRSIVVQTASAFTVFTPSKRSGAITYGNTTPRPHFTPKYLVLNISPANKPAGVLFLLLFSFVFRQCGPHGRKQSRRRSSC